MANIRSAHTPAPLDISHLNLGEPLREAPSALGTALIKRHELGFPGPREVIEHGEERIESRDEDRIVIRRPGHPNVRHMTPRQMQTYSESLYAAGLIDFDDYEFMAFQSDLHPRYNATIGALIGKAAAPDKPRDYIVYWMERLTFAKRYHAADAPEVRRATRILKALKMYPQEADALVMPKDSRSFTGSL